MKQFISAALALLLLTFAVRADQPPAPAADGLIARWPAADDAAEAFDGGQFLTLPAPANAGEGPFSVSVWINASNLSAGDATYGRGIARSTRGEQIGDWILSVHPDGRVRFCNWRSAGDDTSGSHITKDPVIVPEEWQHVAATWDGTASRLFVNGVEAQCTRASTAAGWGAGHEVGRGWTDPGYYWSGGINDLRVLGKALSNEEILVSLKARPADGAPAEVLPAGDSAVSAALDREILARLAQLKLETAPPADDAEFLRRVTLDLTGRIPTAAETAAFLADAEPQKRDRLIDTLLSGREMPAYWSQVMSGWLMPMGGRRDANFLAYLRQGLRKNKPWDQSIREMLLAREGQAADQNAKLFLTYRKGGLSDTTIARDIGQAILGANLRFAQCHDHPHVPAWTHQKFLGLAAFFTRSFEHAYTAGGKKLTALGEKAAGELEFTAADGVKRVVPPTFLDGTSPTEPPPPADPPADAASAAAPPADAPPPIPAFSRREALAMAATAASSPYLKRAMANRVWQKLMGRGLVEPVDMLHEGNPPTHPALLDLLADDFAGHGYDLRRLIGVIVHSQAYARSSHWPSGGLPDERAYAVAVPKPLDADQLALSLPVALSPFNASQSGASKTSPRAVAWAELLAEFDAPAPDFEPTAKQALFLLNSDSVQKRVATDGQLAAQLSAVADDSELARQAYLAILWRTPAPDEQQHLVQYLAGRGAEARLTACRELVWALVTSAEFRFNH